MQRLKPLFIITIASIIGIVLGLAVIKSPWFGEDSKVIQELRIVQSPAFTTEASPIPTPTPSPQAALPKSLTIPKLGVTAPMEYVGLDSEERMDIPKDPDNVAWYKYGVPPGETGNAVLAGHLDWYDGPAVFYRLQQLAPGDELKVVDAESREHQFLVTRKVIYENDDFPVEEVFGPADSPRLNLITCDGVFNQTTRNYSHRVVIYAEAKKG